MGGTVNVVSELGKGSTFSITFKVMCKIVPDKSNSDISAGKSEKALIESIHSRKDEIIRNFNISGKFKQ